MAERRPPYAPEYRRPHWSVVGLAPYRSAAKHGDIAEHGDIAKHGGHHRR